MKIKYWKVVSILLIMILIINMVYHIVIPRYNQSIANNVAESIALQQTQTGNILIVDNNTIQAINIKQLCGS